MVKLDSILKFIKKLHMKPTTTVEEFFTKVDQGILEACEKANRDDKKAEVKQKLFHDATNGKTYVKESNNGVNKYGVKI
jgi:hypothetical protein